MASTLQRIPRGQGGMIAGVCAGLAQRFGVSTALMRVGFVIFGLVGAGELAYLILWIIMPKGSGRF